MASASPLGTVSLALRLFGTRDSLYKVPVVHNMSELLHVKKASTNGVGGHPDSMPHTNRALGATLHWAAQALTHKGAFLGPISMREIAMANSICN